MLPTRKKKKLTLSAARVVKTHRKLRPQSIRLVVKLVQRRIPANISTVRVMLYLFHGLGKRHYRVRVLKVHVIVW